MLGLKKTEIMLIQKTLKMSFVDKIIVFGSRAKGNYKKGSDVDLAIIGDEKKLSYYLNEKTNLPYFFDVINLKKITNKNLIAHIKRVGKNIL